MSTIIVSTAELGHAHDISVLSAQLGYPASDADIRKRLQALAKSPSHAVYVACEEGKVLGWIHVFHAVILETGAFCEIGGLVTDEKHRGRGIGRLLVNKALDWMAEQGVTIMRVRSQVKRKEAHAFYLNAGFREIKEQKVFEYRTSAE